MANKPEPISVSVVEAARLSSFGVRTIRRMIADDEIESKLVRNRRLISYQSLKEVCGL